MRLIVICNRAVAKIVEELCDVPILSTLSDEQLENTEVLYQFLKAVTEKANTTNRSFQKDAAPSFVVLVNLLDCAVGAKNKELRKIYIGRMMGLEGKSQNAIMSLIEQVRPNNQSATKRTPSSKKSPQTKSTSRRNSHLSPPKTASKQTTMTPQQPVKRRSVDQKSPYQSTPPRSSRTSIADSPSIGFLSPGTRESPQRLQSIVSRQQREIDELSKKLQEATGRKEDFEERLAQQEQKHRQAMMSMETQSLCKLEDVQSTLEKRVAEQQNKINSLSAEAQKGSAAIRELAALKDELAIHEGNHRQLEEANRKLQVAKSKLQELADVKGALLKEEEAHGRAVDNIVKLENEISHLQPFKRQVENYKKRAVDAEVRLVECQDCLKRLEKRANDENAQIFEDMMMQKSHLAELRQRILDDTKPLSTEIQNGIGEGLSELNPQLKEELVRLRNENLRLRAFQSQRSEDAVQHLEESLEKAEQLSEQYKSNHLSTKEELRQSQDKLKQSEKREKQLEYSVKELETKVQDYEEKVGCLESQCSSINEALEHARQAYSKEQISNNKLQKIVNDLQRRDQELTEERAGIHERLVETSETLENAKQKLDEMNATNERLKDDLQIKKHELDVNDTTLKETSSQLAALHNVLVDKDVEIGRLANEVSEFQKNTQALISELEEERSARNKDAEEAQKVLESTRCILEQKLSTETRAIQENMNSLLEDERKDNRDKQRQAQELISSQESKWKAECKRLKEQLDQIRHRYQVEEKKLRVSIESERAKFESDIKKMSEDYEKQISKLDRVDRAGTARRRFRTQRRPSPDEN